jgi:SlyX protein
MRNVMTNPSTDRLDTFEIRVAHQDETIETLNKTVTAQWAQIDALKRAISRLTDRVQEAESRTVSPAQSEPPPPHY